MVRKDILALLVGGDRRSIGQADRVAKMVSDDIPLFPELIAGLWSDHPLVRMRAADAAEKVTRSHRRLLQPYKKELLGLMAEAEQQELRWHLAAMVPRLGLNAKELPMAVSYLKEYLKGRSSIVKTLALQGLAELAEAEASLRPEVAEILRAATRTGTPAMKARSHKLLLRLARIPQVPLALRVRVTNVHCSRGEAAL